MFIKASKKALEGIDLEKTQLCQCGRAGAPHSELNLEKYSNRSTVCACLWFPSVDEKTHRSRGKGSGGGKPWAWLLSRGTCCSRQLHPRIRGCLWEKCSSVPRFGGREQNLKSKGTFLFATQKGYSITASKEFL